MVNVFSQSLFCAFTIIINQILYDASAKNCAWQAASQEKNLFSKEKAFTPMSITVTLFVILFAWI